MLVQVKHSLTTEEAKQRLEQVGDSLRLQFPADAGNIKQTWAGDVCTLAGKIRGFGLACTMRVSDSDVVARGDLPFLARPFQGPIENAIRKGLEDALRNRSDDTK